MLSVLGNRLNKKRGFDKMLDANNPFCASRTISFLDVDNSPAKKRQRRLTPETTFSSSDDENEEYGFEQRERARKTALQPLIPNHQQPTATTTTTTSAEATNPKLLLPHPPKATCDAETLNALMTKRERKRARRNHKKYAQQHSAQQLEDYETGASSNTHMLIGAPENEAPLTFTLKQVLALIRRAVEARDEELHRHYTRLLEEKLSGAWRCWACACACGCRHVACC